MVSAASRPLVPVYWGDRPLLLHEGRVSAHYGKRTVDFDGSVIFDWQPRPGVSWHGSSARAEDITAYLDHRLGAEPAVTVEIACDMPPNPSRKGATRRIPSAAGTVLTDNGPCDGLEFHRSGDVCDEVIFNLINWIDLLPLSTLSQRGAWWSGRWRLDDHDWLITIDKRRDLDERLKAIRTTRGHAFTHVGVLRRHDQRTFRPSEAKSVLEDLFLFLTFVRGATVGVALPVGRHLGQVTWRRWTSGLSAPFTNAFSWADPHTPSDLAALWPQFRAARNDRHWSNALLRAVRHYAEATQATSTEVTLTLAQAGLELLGTAIHVDRDQSMTFDKWDRHRADWRLRRTIGGVTSPALPRSFKALTAAAKTHGWGDGPAAITAMRNTVSHWTTGKPTVDGRVWAETSQLSLHYLELTLLHALNYSGRAFDRTIRPLSPGTGTTVPWVL